MLLSNTLLAVSRREQVAARYLVFFDFEDAPFRAWEGGAGIFRANGHDWNGLGVMGQIGTLPLGVNDSSGQANFMLSGVDSDIVQLALADTEKVQGREITVWIQFTSGQVALDAPIFLGTWIMNAPGFMFDGPSKRNISVTARSLFYNRKRPRYAHYTDGNQQARHPGDKFFEFTSQITAGLVIQWPKIG